MTIFINYTTIKEENCENGSEVRRMVTIIKDTIKEKSMKKHIQMLCILGLAGMLLGGCSDKTEENPLQAVYATMEEKSYAEALVQLEEIEIVRDNRQEIARLQGICYIGTGRYEEAKEALEKALSYNEGFLKEVDYDINRYLAVAYYHLEQYEDAEHVYAAMAELQPKDAQVHFMHGVTLLELGRYEDGKEAFDRAVALEPSDYDRIIEIYKAFYQFGYRELGLEYVEAAMRSSVNMNEYDKGRMYYHTEQYNQAVSALENVDKDVYEDAALYLGMSYEAMGDYNYAASVYNSGIENSTDPALFNQLGLCQIKRGAYEEALTAFQKGLACEDASFRQALRFNEVVAYEYLADFETAKTLMEAYLKDYPNDAEARREYDFLKTR